MAARRRRRPRPGNTRRAAHGWGAALARDRCTGRTERRARRGRSTRGAFAAAHGHVRTGARRARGAAPARGSRCRAEKVRREHGPGPARGSRADPSTWRHRLELRMHGLRQGVARAVLERASRRCAEERARARRELAAHRSSGGVLRAHDRAFWERIAGRGAHIRRRFGARRARRMACERSAHVGSRCACSNACRIVWKESAARRSRSSAQPRDRAGEPRRSTARMTAGSCARVASRRQ